MVFRYAKAEDCGLILEFIRKLADYEELLHEVVATEDLLREWLFEKKTAEVVFAVVDGVEAGMALYFTNFSTFMGRAGLYLEDLFVLTEYRGQGIGKGLLKHLAQIAVERGYGRFDWVCLDWNTSSLDFYHSIGAVTKDGWLILRLEGDSLLNMAK